MIQRETTRCTEGGVSSGASSSDVVHGFRGALERAMKFISSFSCQTERLHPDFHEIPGESWHGNKRVDASFQQGYQPEHKVVFYFHSEQFSLLDHCQLPVKFARNIDTESPYEYIGLVYPQPRLGLEQVEKWAARFERAEVFTYGETVGGRWKPGVFVRSVKESNE